MLPWQPFYVVRCTFCIYTSSKIQLLNHNNYIFYKPCLVGIHVHIQDIHLLTMDYMYINHS